MWFVQKEVHELAVSNGWWPEGTDSRIIPEKLALIHSEVSEALEEYRVGNLEACTFSESGKPEGFGIELADAMIRILDLAQFLGLDMEDLIRCKHEYNRQREYRHGGKWA